MGVQDLPNHVFADATLLILVICGCVTCVISVWLALNTILSSFARPFSWSGIHSPPLFSATRRSILRIFQQDGLVEVIHFIAVVFALRQSLHGRHYNGN